MDIVTKALLKEFSDSQEITKLSESDQFEYFANYCAVSQHFSDTFDVSQCGVGDFQGADGIALIANGVFIDSEDTIDELVDANGYLHASFVFTQAKTSSSFDLGDMSKFANAVVGFFEDNAQILSDPNIKPFHALKDAVYAKSARFKRGNPQLHLYYITTGTWNEATHLRGLIDDTKARLGKLNIFSNVEFEPVDASRLQEWYRLTQNTRTIQINFSRSVSLPTIPNVEQAYLGALPAPEFLKLLDDGSGGLVRSIFYENIRDYQQGSAVNTKIAKTLSDGRGAEFVLRNNGVTVVAGELSRTGDDFTIKDYQIVNGCQTSNVLFDNKELATSETYIPLKIIVTNDDDVRSQIIVSSNSQNRITDEQLWALEDFQKQLESYFQAHENDDRLFYERRSRQYDSMAHVEKARIVTPPDLVRSFSSMFLNEPHVAGRYYKELIGHIGTGDMFGEAHKAIAYYTAAFAAYRLAWLFRNRNFETRFKVFRFHILLALKIIVVGKPTPPMNSNALEKMCGALLKVLHDPELSEEYFRKAFVAVESAVTEPGWEFQRDTARVQSFRDKVVEKSEAARAEVTA